MSGYVHYTDSVSISTQQGQDMSAEARYFQERLSARYGVSTTVLGKTLVVKNANSDEEKARLFVEAYPGRLRISNEDGRVLITMQ
jgi:hypothetical protein